MVELMDVAGAPFTVSLVRTLVIGVDAVPATAEPVSRTGLIAAATVTVSITLAQFAGVFKSHNWYLTPYIPGGVAAVVLIAPVVVFSVIPTGNTGPVESKAMVELMDVAGAPFTVSLLRTLVIGVEATPATAEPISRTGLIAAVTVIVTVALSQTAGITAGTIQIVYPTV